MNILDYSSHKCKDGSLIEHLARIAWADYWKGVILAMFTAYFDASGSEAGQPVLAVAGFLASAEAWCDFEKQWLARLSDDDLEYFHTTEFNSSTGQFQIGWKENSERRDRLIRDLVQIIQANAGRKFGEVIVNNTLLSTMPEREREYWKLGAYSLAGRTCAAKVRLWAKSQNLRSVPELVFEDGDKGKGMLTKILERDGFATPIFKPKRDRMDDTGMVIRAAVPLQAADLFAYELFDPMRKIEQDGYIKRIKRTYQEIDRVPGEPGWYEVQDLKELRRNLGSQLRSSILKAHPELEGSISAEDPIL
jgi:hypothetical protein